jgi:hypothetical protein
MTNPILCLSPTEVYFGFKEHEEHEEDYGTEAFKLTGHAERALWSFLCIISQVLQRNVYGHLPRKVDHYVKVFLYEIASLQSMYIEVTHWKKMDYLSTGNFLSMLNLKENYACSRLIQNFWDSIDEMVVQHVKQAFTNINMTSKQWLAALMGNITWDQHLKMLWD